jgi:hypothetical protein
MTIAVKPNSFRAGSPTSLTHVSVLTLSGQRFGFPQGNNFGAILMSAGVKTSRDGKNSGEQFWFPVDRVFDVEKGTVKFRSSLYHYYFGLYGNEEKIKFTDKNPNLLTAYVVPLNAVLGESGSGKEGQFVEGDEAIAVMLVPVAKGMPDDVRRAVLSNMLQACDWFFWPHGQSDDRLFGLTSIYAERGQQEARKDLFLPHYVGSPDKYLRLKYSDEYAGNRKAARVEAQAVARQFLEKAHEIYSRFVPAALESRYGETRWQLPQPAPGRAAA